MSTGDYKGESIQAIQDTATSMGEVKAETKIRRSPILFLFALPSNFNQITNEFEF
jgi:hypothetical protein